MGKAIDRAALNAVAAVALYLFFAAAFHSVWAAVACAFCAMLLLRKVAGGILRRLPAREKKRARARAALEAWARLDAEAAAERLRALLERAYPGQMEGVETAIVARHPLGAPLDASAVLDAWRARGGKRLLVASAARADAGALACARSLAAPSVRLLDGACLLSLLEKFPPPRPQSSPPPRARRRLSPSRERAPRRLLFGLLLLLMYLLLGNPLYLGASLVTLLFAGLGFKKPPVPGRLFDEG